MTTLTEQWKKGELPEGWYYVKGNRAEGIYAYTAEYLNNMYRPRNGEKIIEQVPSYKEWQEYKDANDSMFDVIKMLNKDNYKLEKENAKLKELLKECKEYFENMSPDFDSHDFDEIISKIDQALANNKIKANTVACNKIQEKNNG